MLQAQRDQVCTTADYFVHRIGLLSDINRLTLLDLHSL